MNMGTKKLKGENFTLRKFRLSDLFCFYGWYRDKRVKRFSLKSRPNTILSAGSFIVRRVYNYYFKRRKNYYYWALDIDKKAEGFIGLIETKRDGVYTLYYMLSPEYWNRGYMKKAVKTALSYLKTQDIKTIFAEADEDNTASVKIIEDCGFEFIRVVENRFNYDDGRTGRGRLYRLRIRNK